MFVKKDVQTNDDEIYTKVTSNGTEYYRFYAITDNKEENIMCLLLRKQKTL